MHGIQYNTKEKHTFIPQTRAIFIVCSCTRTVDRNEAIRACIRDHG